MYNINVNKISRFPYPKEQNDVIKGVHCDSFDCLLLKQTSREVTYVVRRLQNGASVDLPVDIQNEEIVCDLEYLSLPNAVFIATSTRVFLVDFTAEKVTAIKFPIPNGTNDRVVATAWNCEQDSLAVAYDSARVMVYCINYSTHEMKLLAEDHPDNKGDENVYLGWGDVKKQFKGKGSAAYLNEFHPPESSYRNDRHDGSISWQFGERYFTVNSINGDEHVVRVFDNECRLYYTVNNLMVPGICSKTVFRAKHNTLATICQDDDGYGYVVLHERNGGYHNKIVPFQSMVHNVAFSTCGRYFAIESHHKNTYNLDVYLQSNFQWSHKYRFTGTLDLSFVSFKFSVTTEDVVAVEMVFKQGIVVYELLKTITAENNAVYVQNSNAIEEYNYKKAIIPPCGVIDEAIRIEDPVNNVIVYQYCMVIVDCKEVAHVYHRKTASDKWEYREQLSLKPNGSYLPVHWCKYLLTEIDGYICLVAIGIDQGNKLDLKRTIRIDNFESTQEICTKNVAYIHRTVNWNDVNVILESDFEKPIKSALAFTFPKENINIQCVLCCNGQLFIDKVKVNGVTSMLAYQDVYLLLTMTMPDDPMDRLLCVDIQNLLRGDIHQMSWTRRVEKGATLVCLANMDGGVILEMTRGNIELVAVRPIIIRNIYKKIEDGMFREAYHIVRRHSMKADVLYDLAPHLFHCNINEFIKSLGSTESVIKFLLPLRNLSTLTPKDFLFVDEHKVEDKKNKICDAIIQSYTNASKIENDVNYYRIVCIALIVKHNHDTYEALNFLVTHFGGKYNGEALLQLADAVTLLKHYGDVNEMYKQALTLYDIELVSTIAQVSGMDPQVYRRFLEMCRRADATHRRFLMAHEGGNYHIAGLYMLLLLRQQSKTVDEFVDYIKDNDVVENVHRAMNKGDGEAFEHVTKLLVSKYVAKGLYKQGAFVLCKAGLTLDAVDLLIQGVNWNEAVELITCTSELNTEEKANWFGRVADACAASEKHKEAVDIYVEKCRNIGKALDCCLAGFLFKEAVILLEKPPSQGDFNKKLYENRLKELLSENLKSAEANYERDLKTFNVHYERLQVVRENRKYRAENNLDGDDAYSEAGSVTTRSHTSASTTTRRTRKLEMKLRSLRHGGKYEDIALMRELYDTMSHLFEMAVDLDQLYNLYVRYADISPNDICTKIRALQQEMKKAAMMIWPEEYANVDDDVLSADFFTENVALLGKEHRSMPIIMNDFSFCDT